ncbi:PLDc N-terminal domain-containing protein [Arthrobacter sp. efr-133-R2A-120]|uniref:PLDc N-terminal domain-containing protein n=1 Tax=Arthrobacter sp. efr-133-R2A-120 TaxID=3040277 RepID=UPI0025514F89|nr:PLDc N-terminal domain-containing protein [Arthrobacter sp. efr-133-R2A-120]
MYSSISAGNDVLAPTGYEVFAAMLALIAIGVFISALVSLARDAKALTNRETVLWLLLVVFVPLVGPAAWLVTSRRYRRKPAVQ